MPVLVVIPARLGSTRLPRKLLQPLGGVPLIVRVAERIHSFDIADRLIVATDSPEIATVVERAGFDAALTAASHPSGTDRVHELASRPDFLEFDIIVNVQGDAPFLPAEAVAGAIERLESSEIGTAAVPLEPGDLEDPSCVKVTVDSNRRALGFSRAPRGEGGGRSLRHLGVYAYRRAALARMAGTAPAANEQAEALEQLRALNLGMTVGVAVLEGAAGPAVDTLPDLEAARAHWTLLHEVTR